ncbi:MAG TPA: hypothetical protein VLI55_19950 [Bryobacteraceae bacterium]|jgi:hypothetical protein|nr:hypothetical protein [Bryobacteraceae bacterium]
MAESDNEKISYVTFDGRTIVNARALLRDPKVRRTIEKLSKLKDPPRNGRGVTFLTPRKAE